MKLTDYEIRTSFLFIILQIVCYGAFLTLDLTGSSTELSSYIKYTIIILCFCYVLLPVRSKYKGIIFYLRTALFFTVIADLFLLLLDIYIYGVLSFIIVQQIYSYMLIVIHEEHDEPAIKVNGKGIHSTVYTYLRRMGIQLTLATALCLLLTRINIRIDSLLIITVFYFISLVTNVILAVKIALLYPYNKANILFSIGMFLFFLCDVNVGLFNMSGFLSLPGEIYNSIYTVSSIMMWVFYAPSQVLIAISKFHETTI